MSSFQFEIQLRVINAVCSSGGTGSFTDLKTMVRTSSATQSCGTQLMPDFFSFFVDDSFYYYDKCVGDVFVAPFCANNKLRFI